MIGRIEGISVELRGVWQYERGQEVHTSDPDRYPIRHAVWSQNLVIEIPIEEKLTVGAYVRYGMTMPDGRFGEAVKEQKKRRKHGQR